MADDHEKNQQLLKNEIEEMRKLLSSLLKKLEECIKKLLTIADDLDGFHRGATIASVTGSSVGIAGGITALVGLAMAPFTFGASLVVSGIGMGAAVAGGVTGAGASIADTVNMKKKCSEAEEIVNAVNTGLEELEKASKKLDALVKAMESKQMTGEEISDAARIGGRGVFVALEVGRMIQLGKVSAAATRGAQLAARGAQAVRVISGVFTALFIIIDAVFVVKGAMELYKGSKTEESKQIRKCAEELKELYPDLQKLDEDLVPQNEMHPVKVKKDI